MNASYFARALNRSTRSVLGWLRLPRGRTGARNEIIPSNERVAGGRAGTERVMSELQEPKLTPDQAAAHEFLSELRTRISTQPLPYQHGVESRALESLWEVFAHARTAMKNHPGC